MMGHFTRHDRAAVDALAARLQAGAPLFFGGDERTFYRARELLQAARDGRDRRDPESSSECAAEALGLLLSVPLSGDPTAVCAELADLRCFHGLVALPLAAAAAAAEAVAAGDDIGSLGYRPGAGAGAAATPAGAGGFGASGAAPAAQPAECYEYVCVALRALATGAADPGAPPGSLGVGSTTHYQPATLSTRSLYIPRFLTPTAFCNVVSNINPALYLGGVRGAAGRGARDGSRRDVGARGAGLLSGGGGGGHGGGARGGGQRGSRRRRRAPRELRAAAASRRRHRRRRRHAGRGRR